LRLVPRQGQPQDGCRIDVDLLDDGLNDVIGKLGTDGGNLFPNILDGKVDIPFQFELHDDTGYTVNAQRVDCFHPVDRTDRFLDLVGYIDIHDLRACSGQTCRNVDKGEFYLGEEVNADGRIADDAQNNKGENEHGGKNGSLDRGIRNPHGYVIILSLGLSLRCPLSHRRRQTYLA